MEKQDDTLKDALKYGIIDLSYIQEQIIMNKRREYLDRHPNAIYQGADKKWYTYLPTDNGKRTLKKRNTKKEIEDIVIAYWKDVEDNPTIEDIFKDWNQRRLDLNKISHSTFVRYQQVFDRHYKQLGKRRIRSLSPADISDFLENEISKHNLSAKSFSNLKSITKGYLKRAKKLRFIDFNVTDLLNDLDISDREFKPKKKDDSTEVFTNEEVDILFAYMRHNLDIVNLGLMLLFFSGLRIGELAALKWSDYDGQSLSITKTETRVTIDGESLFAIKETPKTDAGIRKVVLPQNGIEIMSRIRQTNPFGEYIFMRDGERIKTFSFRNRLYHICDQTKLKHRSPHKIRKTYASILLDNSIDSKLIQSQMGHTDISCTEIYYHKDRRNMENKKVIMDSITEFNKMVTVQGV